MSICGGIAGRRGYNPTAIMIHNDAAGINANLAYYQSWLPGWNKANGFAHEYQTSTGRMTAEDHGYCAWHCGNYAGNRDWLSIEVCQSMGDYNTFKANEDKALQFAAEMCKRYGIVPSRSTIRLHREVYATACPHRSWELHGQSVDAVKDYFIGEINKYLKGAKITTSVIQPVPPTPPQPATQSYKVENYGVMQITDSALNVRTSPNTTSNKIDLLPAGHVFKATRIVRNGENVNGYTTWCEVEGRGWVSMAYTSPYNAPAPATSQRIARNGTFSFHTVMNIRSGPSTTSAGTGQCYYPGETVNYDSYIVANGYTWISYISYSGERRYVAVKDSAGKMFGSGF